MKPFYAFKVGELFCAPHNPERVYLKVSETGYSDSETGQEFSAGENVRAIAMIEAHHWSDIVPEYLLSKGYDDERLREEVYRLIMRTKEYLPLDGKNYYLEPCQDPRRFRVSVSSGAFVVQERVGWLWYTIVFCETDTEESRLSYYTDLSNKQNPLDLRKTRCLRLSDYGIKCRTRSYFYVKSDAETVVAVLESQNQQK